MTTLAQSNVLRKDGYAIEVQLAAIKQNDAAVKYIKEPSIPVKIDTSAYNRVPIPDISNRSLDGIKSVTGITEKNDTFIIEQSLALEQISYLRLSCHSNFQIDSFGNGSDQSDLF